MCVPDHLYCMGGRDDGGFNERWMPIVGDDGNDNECEIKDEVMHDNDHH